MGKELFLTLWMGGTTNSWCRTLAEGHLKRVLDVTTGESERIWHDLGKEWGAASSDDERRARVLQYIRAADGKKRSADGTVKRPSTARQAMLMQAVNAAVAMYNKIAHTDLNSDVDDLIHEYKQAARKTREFLLAVPEHKIFTDVCKDKDGAWLPKPSGGGKKDDKTAFHYLLSHYEVPQLLFTVDYFEQKGYDLDPYIHDGNLLRRNEFANTPEEAQKQLDAFLKTNVCANCDRYVGKMMLEHYGVPAYPMLAAKSLM